MEQFLVGEQIREIATGELWWVASVYHSDAPYGASVLAQKTLTSELSATSSDARCFRCTEIEKVKEIAPIPAVMETLPFTMETLLEVVQRASHEQREQLWHLLIHRGKRGKDYTRAQEKRCARCEQMLPLANFAKIYNKKTQRTFYASYCRECINARSKEWRNKNLPSAPARQKRDWSTVTELLCRCCGETKSVSEFSPNRSSGAAKCPYQYYCKKCFALKRRKERGQAIDKPYQPRNTDSPEWKLALETGFKQCNTCHHVKSLEDFYKAAGSKDGRAYTCRACHSEKQKARGDLKRGERSVRPIRNSHEQVLQSGMKYCGGCQQTNLLTDFSPVSKGVGNVDNRCKACKAKVTKEWYRKQQEAKGLTVKEGCQFGRDASFVPIPLAKDLIVWTCNRCQQEKPIGDFYVASKTGKPRTYCKACDNEMNRLRREKKRVSPIGDTTSEENESWE